MSHNENTPRRPARWRTLLSTNGLHTRDVSDGSVDAAARDRLLKGYVESRQSLRRSIERCECAETSRFLRMIKAGVDDRICELAAQESALGAVALPARPTREAAGKRFERDLTARQA